MLACLGEQLNIDPAKFDVYARRDATRREHFGELCDQLGYRALSVDLNRALRAWLIPMAVATPQPFALMSALLDELRRRKILVPRISVLERIVTQARTQAEQAVHHLLGEIVAGTKTRWTRCCRFRRIMRWRPTRASNSGPVRPNPRTS